MKRGAFSPGRKKSVGWIVVALIMLIASPPSAFSAERVVFGEYFTWNDCYYCQFSGPVVDDLITRYGVHGSDAQMAGRFAVVQYHVWDGYEVPWGYNRATVFYAPIWLGTPTFIYDGLWDAYPPYSSFESKFLTRAAIPTPVTMDIGAEETSPNTYEITVQTCLESGALPVDLRIYTIMAEDQWPLSPAYSRNTFRVAAPITDISLAAGECDLVTHVMTLVPALNERNVRIIAWAQEPNSSWRADAYQAAEAAWPFEPLSLCPCDCQPLPDGVVNIPDFLAMLATWGQVGAPCDVDGGGVGITDFLIMLAQWGPCS